MSRNGSGVYSLPAGSVVANGDTSDATDVNTPLADIAADLNVARPIVAGGTGATSATGARISLGAHVYTKAEFLALDTSAVADGTVYQVDAGFQEKDAGETAGTGASIKTDWRTKFRATPEIFGYSSSGTVAANTTAFQKALESGLNLFIERGKTYTINQINLDGVDDLYVFGGGTLKANYGTNDAIIKLENCKNAFFEVINVVGTSDDDSGSYDSANQHAGLWFDDSCEFPKVVGCNFTKFSSFAIRAKDLAGDTNTRGLTVSGCTFYDFGAANDSFWQTAILLQEDAEYSLITGNYFYSVPAAVSNRSSSGGAGNANLTIANNMIQKCTNYDTSTGGVQTNRGCIFSDTPAAQSGKMIIYGNHINHNDSGIIPIVLNGVASLPLNTVMIKDNYMLVNGTTSIGHQIYLVNHKSVTISGNVIRPKSATPTDGAVYLEGCPGAVVNANKFQNVYDGVDADDIWLTDDTNVFEGTLGGSRSPDHKPISSGKATTRVRGSAGALDGAFQSSSDYFTMVRNSTGNYTITLGSSVTNYITGGLAQYTINISPDALVLWAVTSRTATDFVIELTDNAGTAVDANLLVTVTSFLRS